MTQIGSTRPDGRRRTVRASGATRLRAGVLGIAMLAGLGTLAAVAPRAGAHPSASAGPRTYATGEVLAPTTAIQHIVVIYQENHSFDNAFGLLCQQLGRCDGSSTGYVHDATGQVVPYQLGRSPDKVPAIAHDPTSQTTGVDGGAMDGFDEIGGCSKAEHYACLTQYAPSQLPNLAQLATNYTISDRTFEPAASASWGAHLELAASTLQGFTGDNPGDQVNANGQGWGCNTQLTASWRAGPRKPIQQVPSCIPNRNGTGAFEPTPVPWTPTIMDRLDAAGLSWKLYTPQVGERGYGWAICPTFADCIGTQQDNDDVSNTNFVHDARAGRLPAWSVVTPNAGNSQHNGNSMKLGDNWIGDAVSAVMAGPDWSSTAIFITYDDCGCFFDHVPPPGSLGIRVPMVIVSPYVDARHTDSTVATYNSMLAFTEHVYNLTALTSADANAYDYAGSFNLPVTHMSGRVDDLRIGQAAREPTAFPALAHPGVHFVQSSLTPAEAAAVAGAPPDVDDPY